MDWGDHRREYRLHWSRKERSSPSDFGVRIRSCGGNSPLLYGQRLCLWTPGEVGSRTTDGPVQETDDRQFRPDCGMGGAFGWGNSFPHVGGQDSIDNEYLLVWLLQGYVGLTALILIFVEGTASLVRAGIKARSIQDTAFRLHSTRNSARHGGLRVHCLVGRPTLRDVLPYYWVVPSTPFCRSLAINCSKTIGSSTNSRDPILCSFLPDLRSSKRQKQMPR